MEPRLPKVGDSLRRKRYRLVNNRAEEYWEPFFPLDVNGMNVLALEENGRVIWLNEQQWEFDNPVGAT